MPCVLSANYLVASNRETVTAFLGDDVNSNGLRDAEECYGIANTDLLIGRLDSDLPESIRIPRVLSAELINEMSDCNSGPLVSYRLTEIQNKIDQWESGNAKDYQINVMRGADDE